MLVTLNFKISCLLAKHRMVQQLRYINPADPSGFTGKGVLVENGEEMICVASATITQHPILPINSGPNLLKLAHFNQLLRSGQKTDLCHRMSCLAGCRI